MNSNIQELKGRIKDSPHSILIEICDILKEFSELELKDLCEYTENIKEEKFKTHELLKEAGKDETSEYDNCLRDYAALVCILIRIKNSLTRRKSSELEGKF